MWRSKAGGGGGRFKGTGDWSRSTCGGGGESLKERSKGKEKRVSRKKVGDRKILRLKCEKGTQIGRGNSGVRREGMQELSTKKGSET